ncbi:MAG: protein-L-isoaspartate(D-aspartate) O-methyltransferase [Planctomycetota bacterium]
MRALFALLVFMLAACGNSEQPRTAVETPVAEQSDTPVWDALRKKMVREQIQARGIDDPLVLAALGKVPRHEFVPGSNRSQAYEDHPLPIGERQTISQPYIVAFMANVADLQPGDKVLEIGTGSGYGAAVLAEIAKQVFSIEILEPLAKRAQRTIKRLGYKNIEIRHGDGYRGWPEEAPFDAIVVTAAPPKVPEPLKEQLAVGGHLVIPVGKLRQEIRVITRTKDGFVEHGVLPVRFVPMTGEAEEK